MRYFLILLTAVVSFYVGGLLVKGFKSITRSDSDSTSSVEDKSENSQKIHQAFSLARAKQLALKQGNNNSFKFSKDQNFGASFVPVQARATVRYIGPDFEDIDSTERQVEETPSVLPPPPVVAPRSNTNLNNPYNSMTFGGVRVPSVNPVKTAIINDLKPRALSTPIRNTKPVQTFAVTIEPQVTVTPTTAVKEERVGDYLFRLTNSDIYNIFLVVSGANGDEEIPIGFEKRESNQSFIQFDEDTDQEIWSEFVEDLVVAIQATSDILPPGVFNIRFTTIPSFSLIIPGGLRIGDTLISINGEQVSDILKGIAPPNDEIALINGYDAAKSIELIIQRDRTIRRAVVSRR